MKLQGLQGIKELGFDIENRNLTVFHTKENNEIFSRLDSILPLIVQNILLLKIQHVLCFFCSVICETIIDPELDHFVIRRISVRIITKPLLSYITITVIQFW